MAKRRRFKCSKCDRKFSMAAHLARHMSTLHASKKAKAAKKKKGRVVAKKKRTAVSKPAARTAASGLGGALASMNAYRNHLSAQRSEIDNRIQAIDGALAAMGSGSAKLVVARRKPDKRPRGGSLKDYIARVLRGLARGKSVGDIAAAVKKAGYKSKDKRLSQSVGKAMAEMRNVTRVERGVYRLE
jgi:hypothetical protein